MKQSLFRPPQEVIDAANLVWTYAGCDKDEVRHEKDKLLDKSGTYDEVSKSYLTMAKRIRDEQKV